MLKKGYKVRVMANKFDLNTLPIFVGPERTQAAFASTRATFLMVDVNATGEPLQGRITNPLERVTTAMFTG